MVKLGIIAMDNTNQLNASSLFNLKAYGLVVYLLNNNIKVKWIITAGKEKDGIDFIVTSDQIKPTLNATAISRTFKTGPFVIFSSDTTGVVALIDAYYSANSLSGRQLLYCYITWEISLPFFSLYWGPWPCLYRLADNLNKAESYLKKPRKIRISLEFPFRLNIQRISRLLLIILCYIIRICLRKF